MFEKQTILRNWKEFHEFLENFNFSLELTITRHISHVSIVYVVIKNIVT